MKMESLTEAQLPSACLGCGICMRICPQGIKIPEYMKKFAQLLGKLPSWKKICAERAAAAKKLKEKVER